MYYSIDVVSYHDGIWNANESTPYATLVSSTNSTTIEASNHYKKTKIIAEMEVLKNNNSHSHNVNYSASMPSLLKTCALRPGHIFGPGIVL